MNKLLTETDIAQAILDGKTVYWRSDQSEVVRTKSGHYNIHTKTGEQTYAIGYLPKVIKKYGLVDFYTKVK